MNKLFTLTLFIFQVLSLQAQNTQRPFQANLYNDEFQVVMKINFYDQNITVPGQELYGLLPGYLAKKYNSFSWVITSAKVKGNKAQLALINDYGSEDLTATLMQKNDSIYILKQETGSSLKVPNNGKWQKLPKVMELKRTK